MIRLLLWPGLPYLLAAVVVSVAVVVLRRRDRREDSYWKHVEAREALRRIDARRGA